MSPPYYFNLLIFKFLPQIHLSINPSFLKLFILLTSAFINLYTYEKLPKVTLNKMELFNRSSILFSCIFL